MQIQYLESCTGWSIIFIIMIMFFFLFFRGEGMKMFRLELGFIFGEGVICTWGGDSDSSQEHY